MKEDICEAIASKDGVPYYVGGCVRDQILGISPKDWDIEVFNMAPDELKALLDHYGIVHEVGESFGVLLLRTKEGGELQFSTPRKENKSGRGHRGFLCELDPTMTVEEASCRRDYTINAMYQHWDSGEILDHHGGREDLQGKVLRHVDQLHFGEDPLRVLRGMRFAGRFDMVVAADTAFYCKQLRSEFGTLAVERVWKEWYRWATESVYPSAGLDFLRATGWEDLWPELSKMTGVPQDPHWHPEGPVDVHVHHVCDAMAQICNREGICGEDKAVLMFAALTHDMGKPSTTVFERDRWRSPGHAEVGVPVTRSFLKSIGCLQRIIDRVLPLVAEHMFTTWKPQTRRTVRRLKVRLGDRATLDELLLLMEADFSGRPPHPAGPPEGAAQIRELNEELPPKIEPLLTGLHIIKAGVRPGPEVGRIKKQAMESQLCEEFTDVDGAIEWLNRHLNEGGV
jgi:tRNA nucleotidyltransferase (CCA-adding enzyme)